jgi:hypothetical protein
MNNFPWGIFTKSVFKFAYDVFMIVYWKGDQSIVFFLNKIEKQRKMIFLFGFVFLVQLFLNVQSDPFGRMFERVSVYTPTWKPTVINISEIKSVLKFRGPEDSFEYRNFKNFNFEIEKFIFNFEKQSGEQKTKWGTKK